MMHLTRVFGGLLLAFCAAALPDPANASCAAPDRPNVEVTAMTTRLNSYAEGAGFCVAAKTEYCPECEPGWWHVCKDGRWVAERYRQCPDRIQPPPQPGANSGAASFLPLATTNPAQIRGGAGAGSNGPNRSPGGGANDDLGARNPGSPGELPPVSGACRITGTC